ncbi:MAG: hypothetical protein KDJ38_02700 [Gammaproteobacteria bacterium]|nr:hypothetical protein [Gammaproteobacteria bacterium]
MTINPRALMLAIAIPLSASILAESLTVETVSPSHSGKSDILTSLVTDWSAHFSRLYPDTTLRVLDTDAANALLSLGEGAADISPMSQAIEDAELKAFTRRFGYEPTPVKVAIAPQDKRDSSSRFLYVYVNKQPAKPLAEPESQFVKLILSRLGQEAVASSGYEPIPESVVHAELEKIL